jgi:histidine triad (HIT) family protein
MEGCLFCRIIDGDVAAHRVLDDDHVVAFLDHRPLFPGHVLVVPRRHVVTLPDLPGDEIGPFFARVQALAEALPAALDAAGTLVANNNIVSQSVPHLHVHVVPRRPKDGLRGFFWPRTRYADDAQMADVAARISAQLDRTRR